MSVLEDIYKVRESTPQVNSQDREVKALQLAHLLF